jgi:hypothetical protein
MALQFVKVFIADAAHLLGSESSRECYIGFDEESRAHLSASTSAPIVPKLNVVASAPTPSDIELELLRRQVAELTGINARLATGTPDAALISQVRALTAAVARLQGAVPTEVVDFKAVEPPAATGG